jgi:hypothetical protein
MKRTNGLPREILDCRAILRSCVSTEFVNFDCCTITCVVGLCRANAGPHDALVRNHRSFLYYRKLRTMRNVEDNLSRNAIRNQHGDAFNSLSLLSELLLLCVWYSAFSSRSLHAFERSAAAGRNR